MHSVDDHRNKPVNLSVSIIDYFSPALGENLDASSLLFCS